MKKGLKAFAPAILPVFSLFIVLLYAAQATELLPAGWFAFFLYKSFLSKLLFIAALGFAAYGAGGAVFSRFLPPFHNMLEEWLFKTALGLILISYSVFLISISGLLYRPAGLVLLAAFLAVGFKEIRLLLKRLSGLRPAFGFSAPAMLLGGISLYFLLNGLLAALKPPTGFDVLMYHIGVPKLYLEAHGMFPTPDINGSSFPFGAEMLYLLGMMLDGAISANLVNYSFAILGGLAAASFARRFLPGVSPLAPFAVYVSVPLIVWLMPQAYVELALAFYSMLALMALMAAFEERDGRWLLMAAAMAGFTMALKYTGALIICVLSGAVAVRYLLVEKKGAWGLLQALKLALIAAVVCLPWYVRNVIYYSNPLYPLMAGVFNGVTGYGANVVPYSEAWSGGPAAAIFKIASSLWKPTLYPQSYQAGWSSAIGPYFLMFIPGIALLRGIPRPLKWLLWLSLIFYFLFLFGAQENLRYLAPVMPALSVLAGYPIGRLVLEEAAARRYAGIALAAVFAFAALAANTGRMGAMSYPASGPAAEDEYYMGSSMNSGYLASYPAWKWIGANLPADAVIYQLWDDASVYFRERKTIGVALAWGETGRQKVHLIRGHNNFGGYLPGEEIIGNLKAMGAGYFLVNANREGHALPEDVYFTQHARLIYQESGIFLFQIIPDGP